MIFVVSGGRQAEVKWALFHEFFSIELKFLDSMGISKFEKAWQNSNSLLSKHLIEEKHCKFNSQIETVYIAIEKKSITIEGSSSRDTWMVKKS